MGRLLISTPSRVTCRVPEPISRWAMILVAQVVAVSIASRSVSALISALSEIASLVSAATNRGRLDALVIFRLLSAKHTTDRKGAASKRKTGLCQPLTKIVGPTRE